MDQKIVNLGAAMVRAANKALAESEEVLEAYAECLQEGYVIGIKLALFFERVSKGAPEKPVINTDVEWLDKLHDLEDLR